jgi:hypothetical protein
VIYNKFKDINIIKHVIFYYSFLFIINISLADDFTKEKNINFTITPSIAYKYDVFKWSVPSYFFSNKKCSELVWKNRVIEPSIKIEIEPQPKQFNFLAQIKYGYILKNTSKNWDYDWLWFQDNTGNFKSYQLSKTKSLTAGNTFSLSGAIGYSVNLFQNNLFTFYFGYDFNNYKNKDYGLYDLIYGVRYNSSNELVSKYYFKNNAPWIGLSIKTSLNEKITIIPTIKIYNFKYIGKGYWLLRDDLKQNPSFKHHAIGKGLGLNIDFLYEYNKNLDFKVNLSIEKFKMKKGKKTRFSKIDTLNSKLYNLSLRSSSFGIGFKYKL